MAYISVKEASQQYGKSEKTVRRLYENKKLARSQGYVNKKGKWKLNTEYLDSLWLDSKTTQPTGEQLPEPEPKTSQNNSEVLTIPKEVYEDLRAQLKAKDEQLERLDKKLDQQQQLTAQLQNQLLIAEPKEPQESPKSEGSIKPQPQPKKPVKKPVRKPQSKNNKQVVNKPAKKKKRWFSWG